MGTKGLIIIKVDCNSDVNSHQIFYVHCESPCSKVVCDECYFPSEGQKKGGCELPMCCLPFWYGEHGNHLITLAGAYGRSKPPGLLRHNLEAGFLRGTIQHASGFGWQRNKLLYKITKILNLQDTIAKLPHLSNMPFHFYYNRSYP